MKNKIIYLILISSSILMANTGSGTVNNDNGTNLTINQPIIEITLDQRPNFDPNKYNLKIVETKTISLDDFQKESIDYINSHYPNIIKNK